MSVYLQQVAAEAFIESVGKHDGAAYIVDHGDNDHRIDVFVNLPRVMADVLAAVDKARQASNSTPVAPEYVGETAGGIRVYSSPTLGHGEIILLSEDPYDANP